MIFGVRGHSSCRSDVTCAYACGNHLPDIYICEVQISDLFCVMADSQQLPSSKRTRVAAADGVDEPDYSVPSGGSTAVEALPRRAEQLDHSHAKR